MILFDSKRALAALSLAGGLALVSTAVAAPARGGATSIAKLRAEIDEIAADLETERVAARDELAALRAERAELERQVRAATSRKTTLERIHKEAKSKAAAQDERTKRWDKPTHDAVAAAQSYVEASLPFAREQRLAALERIERDLSIAQPDYGRAVERLWRLVEEEEALGREMGLGQQRLTIDAQPQIVDVIRLSMALLYFRTRDGRYGWVAPGPSGWRQEVVTDPAHVQAVSELFEAFERSEAMGPVQLLLPAVVPEPGSGQP